MSETSKRGKDFELKVAKILRTKIDRSAKRNPGSHANWNRRSDVFTDLPFHIEAKDHETLKPKEWFRQADEASSGKTPVVAFQMDSEVMAIIRFEDFANLLVEIADQKLEIEELRQPQSPVYMSEKLPQVSQETRESFSIGEKIKMTDGTLKREIILCKNGHICTPGKTTCMTKGCPYSSTYIKPKAIKEKK